MKPYQIVAVFFIMALVADKKAYAGFVAKKYTLATVDSSLTPGNHARSRGNMERIDAVNMITELLEKHDGTAATGKRKDTRGWEGTVSIICGILAMLTFYPFLPALIFGAIGMEKGRKNRNRAIAGFILGIVAPVLWLSILFLVLLK